jgi:hypothetical protein
MGKIKELLHLRHANVINSGGEFTFSITYSIDCLREIQEMGEEFTSKYQFTVANIPGMPGNRLICISLKPQSKRNNATRYEGQ